MGTIDVEKMIDAEYALTEGVIAFEHADRPCARKVLLKPYRLDLGVKDAFTVEKLKIFLCQYLEFSETSIGHFQKALKIKTLEPVMSKRLKN